MRSTEVGGMPFLFAASLVSWWSGHLGAWRKGIVLLHTVSTLVGLHCAAAQCGEAESRAQKEFQNVAAVAHLHQQHSFCIAFVLKTQSSGEERVQTRLGGTTVFTWPTGPSHGNQRFGGAR